MLSAQDFLDALFTVPSGGDALGVYMAGFSAILIPSLIAFVGRLIIQALNLIE